MCMLLNFEIALVVAWMLHGDGGSGLAVGESLQWRDWIHSDVGLNLGYLVVFVDLGFGELGVKCLDATVNLGSWCCVAGNLISGVFVGLCF